MSDHVDSDAGMPRVADAIVEAYETESGTVLYDAANPLAWIESTRVIRLDEAA